MKFFPLSVLLFSAAIFAQNAPHGKLEFIKVENLNAPIDKDISFTWREAVKLVFKDVNAETNTIPSSPQFRQFNQGLINPSFDDSMKIESLKAVWFMSKGKEYLAILFDLKPLGTNQMHLFPLAVFTFSPKPVLVDAIPGRLSDSSDENVEFDSILPEIILGKGKLLNESVGLINKNTIHGVGTTATIRYFMLDDSKLHVIYQSPTLLNSENCDEIIEREFLSPNTFYRPVDNYYSYKVGIGYTRRPNKKCPDYKDYFATDISKEYKLIWNPQKRIFRQKLTHISGMPTGIAWGMFSDDESEFDGKLEVAKAYHAQAFYDSKNGLRLVLPLKTAPYETIQIEWDDAWYVLPDEKITKRIKRKIKFQVTSFDTKILANGRHRTVISCQIESFGSKSRFGEN